MGEDRDRKRRKSVSVPLSVVEEVTKPGLHCVH